MAFPLFTATIFITQLVVMTIVFYLAGVLVVGRKRALLSDAFVISLLGAIIGAIFAFFFPLLGAPLSLLVWLLLIRHYYETGWLGAIAIGVLAAIIHIVILIVLATIFSIPLIIIGTLLH